MDKREANQYSPLSLAFLGDAVYEQLVREKLLLQANMSAHRLHDETVKRVCAKFQASAADALQAVASEDEKDIMRRGRNAVGSGVHVPKSSNPAEYSKATSLETLFGWLHLQGNADRIRELFEYIWKEAQSGNV